MSDNVTVTPSASYTVAADDIGGIGFQRVKIALGADGVNDGDVNALNPMPVSGAVGVSGTVTIAPTILTVNTAGTVAGASVTAQVSGTVTVLDGASVTIQQGASVVAQVSGTVTIAPTTLTVNTAAAATTVISGAVSISAMPAVSISVSAVLGTIITQLGTQMVSMAQTSVSVAAVPTVQSVLTIITQLGTQMVSIAQTSVSIAALPTVNTVQTIITILGTQIVSVVPGFTVGVTNASVLVGTTATPAADGSGLVVWVANPGAAVATTVLTVSTILGTAVVSVVPGVSVNALVTGAVSISVMPAVSISVSAVLGTIVTILGTVIVLNSGMSLTTGIPAQVSTGQIVMAKEYPAGAVMIIMTATAIAVSANKYLFTIWTGATGAPAAAGTTSWAVPAGRFLRLNALQAAFTSSAILGGSVQVFVGVGATASMVSASISTQLQVMKLQMFGAAALVSAALFGVEADVPAGESIALFVAASTAVISRDLIITGKLF